VFDLNDEAKTNGEHLQALRSRMEFHHSQGNHIILSIEGISGGVES
jgi:hypothetical protein